MSAMRKIFAFLLVTSLLLCSPSSAREFVRSFKLLSDINDSEGESKGHIRKMTKIDPIPELAEVPTAQSKQLISNVDSDSSAYDPCKVSVLCRNNGICKSRGHEYYCECPDTHYGKTCEFIADLKECDGNQCMNNSTCYSIKEPKVVPNAEVLARLHNENQNIADFKNVTMSVKYECWCQHGFEGTFCEFSEGMRRCSEDKCNHHGIVVPFYQGSNQSEQEGLECKCHCEEGYSGDECEFVSPCRDFQCLNNGTCKIDSEDGKAYCECLSSVELFPSVNISGLHCGIINDGEEKDSCFPCVEGQNFMSFLDCLGDRASFSRDELKSLWWADCEAKNPNCLAELEHRFCFNGTCHPVVSRLPSASFSADDKLFLLPKCQCKQGYEGNFCEREVNENCDLQCVHGNCCYFSVDDPDCYNNFTVLPEDRKVCKCDEGYKGERCEFKDPCYSNPCGEALCVELLGDGVSEEVPFTCICKTSQGVSEKSQECANNHYDKCEREDGSPSCLNDGNCYPCSLDQVKNLQLCSDIEQTRGFRCICPPGLKQPFCQENVTACDAHRCLNGGKCVQVPNSLIDYTCDCPPGYSGTFCHISLGVCLQKGDATCVNGVCVEDSNTRRGFRCKCKDGYGGFNCQLKNRSTFIEDNYAWFCPLIAFVIFVSILFVVSAYQLYIDRKNRAKKNSAVVSL